MSAWMKGAGAGSERLALAFEEAFSALWRRARQTLGDITLTAIVDRVLYDGAERFPILSELQVGAAGLRWKEPREAAHGAPPGELAEAIRFVLEQFLTVLGNLTADILTPALHAELRKVGSEQGVAREKKTNGKPRSLARKARKDARS